jgi:hypothetical protein
MKKSATKYEILTAAKCGIEFEFFSEKNSSQIARELGRVLNKKIVVPTVSTGFDKEEKGKYHSELEPTATVFKLEKDYSGGKNMRELITGPLAYEEARIVIIKTLEWVRSNGWTDKKCAIHLNISFNPFMSKLKNEILNIDILKFILIFDENFVYDRFPDRKNSVYARSINHVFPANRFTFQSPYDNIDPNNYIVPDEKYYGVNFTKRVKNYLEFRYLGGEGYEFKTQKILEILDYSILKIYESLQNPNYTLEEMAKFKKMMADQKAISESFSSPERFFLKFPNINVFVDMRGNSEILKSFWTRIRIDLFSAIVDGGMKEGIFNFDTDVSINQLKNAKIKNAHDLDNFEFFDCEIEGSIQNSAFFRCKIRNSRLNKCKLIQLNEVFDSKVEHTSSYPSNLLSSCYINSPEQIIEGKIEGGVVRNAILGKDVQVSERTLLVETTLPIERKINIDKHDKK